MSVDAILTQVHTSAVRLVRFLYCDTSGIIRGKLTHVDRLKDRLESGIGLVKGMMAMNMLDEMQTDTGLGATGEVRLLPDLDSFAILPYGVGQAMVLCDLVELDRAPWAMCPRTVLKRQIAKALEAGITIQAAFEPEFTLGTVENEEFEPIDESLCFSTEGMNRASPFIEKFVRALELQNVPVELYHPELGHGQHELSVGHTSALAAADRLVIYRETLRGVATDSGLIASMAPKPLAEQAGNGCHLHLSAWDARGERNLFWSPEGLSEVGKQFIAGILKHLPALVAVTCPSVNSYRRLKPRSWSSAFTCWGYENREAAVRVPSTYWGKEEQSTNIEIKCVDNSCNPYLALAAVIAAGLDGIKRNLKAPLPVDVDPSSFNTEEMTKRSIKRLPSSLKEALRALLHDGVIMEALGDPLAASFITVKTSEVLAFSKHAQEFELKQHRTKF